ncbi:hypothetical protein HaLaN_03058 [Haematococcus lacustris]|uniref:Uncharacterized protein n=1 Tax=Haematococcus lacustris TaxID=44745 RepID=A0A699YDN3_HAELA|nr:hypothetical protein HaLaN_03058 [Haematococcus lacustris]
MEGFDGDVRSTVNCLVSRVKELEQQVACLQTTETALRQQLWCVEQEAHVRASLDGRLRKEQEQRMCEAEEAKAELEHRLAWEQEQHQATKARSHEAEQLASDATAAAHEYAARLLTLQAALEQQQAEHARQLARLALGMSTSPGGPPASAPSTPGAVTHALLAAEQGLHGLQSTLQQQPQLIDRLQQHSVARAAHCQQSQLRGDTMDVECCQLQLQASSSGRVRQGPGGTAAIGSPRSASSPGGGPAKKTRALVRPQPHAPAVLDALPVKSHCLPPGAWSSSPGSSANTPSPPTKGCPLACPPPSSVMLPNLPDSTQIVGNSWCNEPEVPCQVSLAQPSSATPAPRPAAMAGTSPFARAAAQSSNGPIPSPEIRPLDNQAVCQAAHPPAVLSTCLTSPQRLNPQRHAEAETAGSLRCVAAGSTSSDKHLTQPPPPIASDDYVGLCHVRCPCLACLPDSVQAVSLPCTPSPTQSPPLPSTPHHCPHSPGSGSHCPDGQGHPAAAPPPAPSRWTLMGLWGRRLGSSRRHSHSDISPCCSQDVLPLSRPQPALLRPAPQPHGARQERKTASPRRTQSLLPPTQLTCPSRLPRAAGPLPGTRSLMTGTGGPKSASNFPEPTPLRESRQKEADWLLDLWLQGWSLRP